MADIEKVVKGLQAHADGCGYRSHYCDAMECPYRYGDESCDIEEMCRDALAMLKEQEHKDKLFHALEDDWKRLKELLKEQEAELSYRDAKAISSVRQEDCADIMNKINDALEGTGYQATAFDNTGSWLCVIVEG